MFEGYLDLNYRLNLKKLRAYTKIVINTRTVISNILPRFEDQNPSFIHLTSLNFVDKKQLNHYNANGKVGK